MKGLRLKETMVPTEATREGEAEVGAEAEVGDKVEVGS